MNRYIYYFLCFSLLIISCRNDDFTETIVEEGPRPAVVVGLIVDEDGVAIEGAEVILSENTMLTDVNGYFKFTSIAASAGGTVLKVEKDGYFDNYKFVFSKIGSQSYVKVAILVFSSFSGLKCINCNSIDNSDNLKISNCDKNTSCSKMNLNLGLVSAFGTGTLLIYKNLV